MALAAGGGGHCSRPILQAEIVRDSRPHRLMALPPLALRPRGFPACASSGKTELPSGRLSSSSRIPGRFISWPLQSCCVTSRVWIVAPKCASVGLEKVGFSSKKARRRRRRKCRLWTHSEGCVCFSYVAPSQATETESKNVQTEGGKRDRKGRIHDEEDAELGDSRSNGVSFSESDDRGGTKAETGQPAVKRRSRRKRAAESGGNDTSGKTSSSSRTGRDIWDGMKRIQLDDPAREDAESRTHEVENNESSVDTDDESGGGIESGIDLAGEAYSSVTGGAGQVLDTWTNEDVVGQEGELRLMFLESIMERARNGDVDGVEEALLEMEIAGIQAGPRAFHGLVVSYTRARDAEGAVQAFRREFTSVDRPLPETFVAMARLFGCLGQAERGEEILAAMQNLKYDPRVAWLILIEELQKAGYLQEANNMFFTGAKAGFRAVPDLYSTLIEENAKVGDHGSAVNALRALQYAGFQATTFHHNCLLMCQANKNVPEVAASTFEDMQYGPVEMKPDTESYNWLLQAHIRHNHGERLHEVIDVVGEMVEDYQRVQPNMRTYALLVECFSKYNVANEAVRHFRALSRVPGGMQYLHDGGRNGDPLSLYLRTLCLEGRADDLLEALEAMMRDKQDIPVRAMFVNQNGRTLVSSWIEPIGADADLGYEVDYIARYVAEGGDAGTRKRWSEWAGRSEDNEGFAFSAPLQTSFKDHCVEMRRLYNHRLIRKLRTEGVLALGPGATEETVYKVIGRLSKQTAGEAVHQVRKPKAASKMLVSELKEELEAQGLPADGTRPVLYQRVQKARRINRARGRPLWVPELSEEELDEVEEDPSISVFMQRLNLENDHTDFWRKRLMGEDQESELFQITDGQVDGKPAEKVESRDGGDDDDDDDYDVEDNDDDDTEDETEEDSEDLAEDGGEDEESENPELLALKLMNKETEAPLAEKAVEDQDWAGEWSGLTFQQKIAKLRSEKLLDPSEMYTIADVWGWNWEREIRAKEPDRWTPEHEVELGMQIMQKVVELGSSPTIEDCATLVHAAMRIPWPEATISLIQRTHQLGFKFGSKLYSDVMKKIAEEQKDDMASALASHMEEVGITATDVIGIK